MIRARNAVPLLLLLVGTVLAAGACGSVQWPWCPPPAEDHIKIPHALHASKDVDCIACHSDAWDAKDLKVTLRPPEDKCMECHQDQKDAGNCTMCHTDPARAKAYPPREHLVTLSHKDHIERVKEDCKRCHTTLPNPFAGRGKPEMNACLGCHEHKADYDDGKCTPCHTDLSRYAIKPVSVFSHRGNWVHEHRLQARTSAETCAKCHEQTFCADCHQKTVSSPIELKYPERVDADYIHRNDYVSRHSIDAAADPALCQRCHGTSFCQSCHEAQGLTPTAKNPRDPHPLGWSFPGASQFHGQAARRDIASCAACHDQGAKTICIDCHKVGGIGGNPHPVSWLSQHPKDEITKNGMCLYCHQ